MSLAVQARHGRDAFAVGSVVGIEETTAHGGELPHQVGIISDHARGHPLHAVDSRHAVRPADQDLVLRGVAGQSLHTPLEGSGSDRRNVVHESLGLHVIQLGAHVATDRGHVRPIDRERRADGPVIVGHVKEHLRPAGRVERAHDLVRATDGDQLSIRRPARSIDRVVGDGDREGQLRLQDFAFVEIPHLEFTHPAGQPAGDRESLAIRREPRRLDAFAEAD